MCISFHTVVVKSWKIVNEKTFSSDIFLHLSFWLLVLPPLPNLCTSQDITVHLLRFWLPLEILLILCPLYFLMNKPRPDFCQVNNFLQSCLFSIPLHTVRWMQSSPNETYQRCNHFLSCGAIKDSSLLDWNNPIVCARFIANLLYLYCQGKRAITSRSSFPNSLCLRPVLGGCE